MFPKSAIIVCPSSSDLKILAEYLDDNGFRYNRRTTNAAAANIIANRNKEYKSPLCFHFQRGSHQCYCDEDWYRNHSELWNMADQRWNFCLVDDFIAWTSGDASVQTEVVPIDLSSLL